PPPPQLFPYTTLFRSPEHPGQPTPHGISELKDPDESQRIELSDGRRGDRLNLVRRDERVVGQPRIVLQKHAAQLVVDEVGHAWLDRKSTRLNSSHSQI